MPRADWKLLTKHLEHFLQIRSEFIECGALAVRAGETGNPTDIQPGVGVALYNGSEFLHYELRSTHVTRKTRGVQPWQILPSLVTAPSRILPPTFRQNGLYKHQWRG